MEHRIEGRLFKLWRLRAKKWFYGWRVNNCFRDVKVDAQFKSNARECS